MLISLVTTPVWTAWTPPLAIASLGALLRREGHEVRPFDWNIELHRAATQALRGYWDRSHLHKWQTPRPYEREIAPRITGPSVEQLAARILEGDPALVGLSVHSTQASLHLARALRRLRPDVPLIAGGQICDPGLSGKKLARGGLFDAVVPGEGEEPLQAILRHIEDGERDLSCIPGLLIGGPDGVEHTGAAAPLPSLAELPWPSYEGLPMELYTASDSEPLLPSRAVSMLLSRGCVRRCDFCLQAQIWGRFRSRDAEDVYAEMAAQVTRHDLRAVHFNDLLINGNVVQLERLCDLLIERPLGISWGGNAIVSANLSRARLKKLKAAGCTLLGFGFESFSEPVLAAMGKNYSQGDVLRLLRDLKEVGLRFYSNLVIGHPAESRQRFEQTVNFLQDHHDLFPEAPTSSLLIVQEGTPIDRERERWGIESWDDDPLRWWLKDGSNDLDERKERARILSASYERLFGAPARITNMSVQEQLCSWEDDVIPRTAQTV